jgi:hypothetical protein
MKSHPQYITNEKGKKVAVILPIQEYYKITEDLEMLEDIKLYDAAKKSKEPSIPIEIAFKRIEAKRKRK